MKPDLDLPEIAKAVALSLALLAPPAPAATLAYPLHLSAGWNLAGNALTTPLAAETLFGAQNAIQTVWKWDAAASTWAFYSPALAAAGALHAYAAAKGYAVLDTIAPGEGFWVAATAAATLGEQSGAGFTLTAAHLSTGWNLVATADATNAENFAAAIGDIASLWGWDNTAKAWYFHSPTLAANATLGDYNRSKGYKDFGAQSIGGGRGLWVDYRGRSRSTLRYPLVDSAQTAFYNSGAEIAAPRAGQAFYGQDAQFTGNAPSYRLSDDGKTVTDQITQLTWMRAPNLTRTTPTAFDKKTLSEAQAWVATVNAANYGGYADWRLPTIKELYSLINFKGSDPSGYRGSDTSVLTPFIDTAYFDFSYGQTGLGERIIDSQYASSTMFAANPDASGATKLFGVNFADGRIKGYDLSMPGGREKTFYVQLVRGANGYGVNAFKDNGDGTVSDAATGLMWSKTDSGVGMNWSDALTWVQAKNSVNYLGHNDWRLPNVKELHSLVDYANAPDYNGKPALDTAYFDSTPIVNENGEADYPYYWTSTTHAGYSAYGSLGGQAAYIPFGRALGYSSRLGKWIDVHGAGSQRSDPKVGPPYAYAASYTVVKNGTSYTGYAFGPQGDAVRGMNFVRLVR